jgi:Fur family transcriptional regulator, ferric uptake regulator
MRKRGYSLSEQMLEALGERGYRDTSPRRQVVQAIVEKDRHFTAEELREQLPKVGRATVYRSLKLLLEAGALCRVLLEDGNLHYQLSHRGHHHHLLCIECGASQDLMGCDIEDQLNRVADAHDFQMSGHWLEVYGRCQKCLPPRPASN